MDRIYQAKLYCNPYSLLVINKHRKLVRVFCPFKVRTIDNSESFKKGKILYVSLVKVGSFSGLVYVIEGREYSSSLFLIII
jgi:hypothetical protein